MLDYSELALVKLIRILHNKRPEFYFFEIRDAVLTRMVNSGKKKHEG